MKLTALFGAAALSILPIAATAQSLPDLAGREVTVVTENAYPPLQFLDARRRGGGLGIRRHGRNRQAAELYREI
jgi:polar amino acid transport system substrate-binding protein